MKVTFHARCASMSRRQNLDLTTTQKMSNVRAPADSAGFVSRHCLQAILTPVLLAEWYFVVSSGCFVGWAGQRGRRDQRLAFGTAPEGIAGAPRRFWQRAIDPTHGFGDKAGKETIRQAEHPSLSRNHELSLAIAAGFHNLQCRIFGAN